MNPVTPEVRVDTASAGKIFIGDVSFGYGYVIVTVGIYTLNGYVLNIVLITAVCFDHVGNDSPV